MMGSQRTVLSTDLDHAFGDDILTPMGDACLGSLRLLTEGIATLRVHREAMASKAGAFWSTTSHLADELVRRHDLSFRDAHQIVGRFVRDAIASGQTPASVDAALLARAAREAGRPEVTLDTPAVRQALDATSFLHTRASEGSVNPRHVRQHIEEVTRAVETHARWHRETAGRIAAAIAALQARARALAGAP